MQDNVRERVEAGSSLPDQDLRIPLKHALVDLQTDLRAECEKTHVSYSSASKAHSGHADVGGEGVQRLFQHILHRWKPGSFAPAEGQKDGAREEGTLAGEPAE